MLLRTIADFFLSEHDWGHNGPTARRKRVYVLINLSLILIHCYAITAASLSAYVELTNERLLFNSLNIIFCGIQLIAVKRNFNFEWLATIAQQYYTVAVIIYIVLTGMGDSQSVPWLAVLPVACMLFLTSWRRYMSLAFWFVGAATLLFLEPDPENASLLFWAICAGCFGAYVSTVSGQLYADDEQFLANSSNTDSLTGVLNRRGLVLGVNHYAGGCLLVLDLDDFKRVNDEFGQEAGDLVLIEVCRRLSESLRKTDRVARLGDEEFAVWFANASFSSGRVLAKRLQDDVSGTPIVADNKGNSVTVTFSAGLLCHEGDQSITRLINACDKLLNRAKKSGKNNIISKPPR